MIRAGGPMRRFQFRRRAIRVVEWVSIVLSVCVSRLDAGSSTLDASKISLGMALRMGNLDGQIFDREKRFYRDVGLWIIDKNGGDSSVSPVGTSLGVDFEALYRVRPSLDAGLAFVVQSTTIHLDGFTEKNFEGVMLRENALMARARYMPFSLERVRFGFEGGLGWGLGTLHRFVFASNQVDTIRNRILGASRPASDSLVAAADSVVRYIEAAARGLEVSGLRYEAALVAACAFDRGVGAKLRVGFRRSFLSPAGTDSLATMSPRYPFPVKAYGFDFSVGVSGSF